MKQRDIPNENEDIIYTCIKYLYFQSILLFNKENERRYIDRSTKKR